MATSSIFTDVKIKNKKLARGLVDALENAKKFQGKEVTISKNYTELKGSSIKNLFGENNDRLQNNSD